MRGKCKICSHWVPIPGQDPKAVPLNRVCTRNPPHVITVPVQGKLVGQLMMGIQAVYPPTTADMECGCCEPAIKEK